MSDIDASVLQELLIQSDADEDVAANVVDALLAIAAALNRIGAALDGPWPTALADALGYTKRSDG